MLSSLVQHKWIVDSACLLHLSIVDKQKTFFIINIHCSHECFLVFYQPLLFPGFTNQFIVKKNTKCFGTYSAIFINIGTNKNQTCLCTCTHTHKIDNVDNITLTTDA